MSSNHQLTELLVEYATYGIDANLFVQKHQPYLPNEQELRQEVETVLAEQDTKHEDR